ncbi:MAG: DUF2780 domain-containing protein, partial [Nitrosopumilaceae archaeon]|nr:DUF2780 domain-containing protein [Nitrosopumilaceae archaeon]
GLGSGGEKLAVISKLGAGFSKLDLGSDMAMKFFPVFENYFREKNDDAVNGIIDKVLGKMG